MSVKCTFRSGGDVIHVIIEGNNLMFLDSNGTISTIEGLKISKGGVVKEFPDLEDNEEWKEIAIKRLKEHIRKMKTEMEKVDYVKEDLIKYGYEPLFYQRAGFRVEKFK